MHRQLAPDSVAHVDEAAARLPRANPHEVRSLLDRAPTRWAPFPTVDDRTGWDAIGAALAPSARAAVLDGGRAAAGRAVAAMPLTQRRAFVRGGDRDVYEKLWYDRRADLARMLAAHVLDPASVGLDAILDGVWAFCEETSWAFPAHDPLEFPDPERPCLDLFACLTAVGLAELCAVLGPVLPGPVVERVRREVDRRVVVPYLHDDTHVWMYNGGAGQASNWTAVCAWGALGASLYLERDTARLASIIVRAARSLEEYLENFDPDGGTSEGVGYWNFGFGSFCQLADLVERRTGGELNWFDAPIVARVARFPLRARLTADAWPNFSDASPAPRFNGPLLLDLGRRLGDPDLTALGTSTASSWDWRIGNSSITQGLRCLAAGMRDGSGELPALTGGSAYFRGVQWLMARVDPADPGTLAVAVKGGHNGELHNQNDIGSLIVRVGGEALVVDPGWGHYTRDYFNEHRYEHFVNRTFGHSVPLPGGTEQEQGVRFRAAVLHLARTPERDRIALDLTGAYPGSAGLEHLERRVELDRAPARVSLVDTTVFHTPARAETAIVTHAEVVLEPGRVLLRGTRATLSVTFDPALVVEVHTELVPLYDGPRETSRIAFRTPGEVSAATVELVLTPS